MNNIHSRRPPIPPHVEKHFKAHAASNKTIKEYCIGVNLPYQTFYAWRIKYHKSRKRSEEHCESNGKPGFSTVGALSLQELRQPLFDIHLSGGCRVSIYQGMTAKDFAPFFKLLSGGSPLC